MRFICDYFGMYNSELSVHELNEIFICQKNGENKNNRLLFDHFLVQIDISDTFW